MDDHTISDVSVIDRITLILRDYRDGLLDSDEDAAAAILFAIRPPTASMIELGDRVVEQGCSASVVWRGMIDRARNNP
jgi:hypothetical protein